MLQDNAVIQEFMEEVKSYIAPLTKGIETLIQSPDKKDALEEIHRLTHIVKGASSMIGLNGLSHMASQMEKMVEDALAGKFTITHDALQLMQTTVDHFNSYASELFQGSVDITGLLTETVFKYRRLRGLPQEDDQEMLRPLLESISANEERVLRTELFGESPAPQDLDTVLQDTILAPPADISLDFDDAAMDFQNMEEFYVEAEKAMADIPSEIMEELPSETAAVEEKNSTGDEDFDAELIEGFNLEAEEHLEEIGRTLNTLSSQITEPVAITSDQRELLRLVRRSVHTLKGASAVVGFKNIAAWAHDIEDLLDWLYEEAKDITPETIALLNEASDLLAQITASPTDADLSKTNGLKEQFSAIMANQATKQEKETTDIQPIEVEDLDITEPQKTEKPLVDLLPKPSRTLRVDIDKIDDLVNLAGELIIALSSFDREMDTYANTVNELDLSRGRVKGIARDLEVGYEVKAIQRLSQTPFSNYAFGNTALNTAEFDGFDSLELDRYSEFNLIIRSLNETSVDINAINTQLANLHSDFDSYLTRQRVLLSELQNKLMLVRMVPMSTISNRMHQTVRDAAKRLKKKVALEIEGEHIELDRLLWSKLNDPLMHLLRNAVDHGIEPPSVREKLGKESLSVLKLSAAREGNQVVIRVKDDGNGLDYNAIREKAQAKGISDNVKAMTDNELKALIFRPGFTTQKNISQISGRGVGLDVVKTGLNDLKGTIHVTSSPGSGMQFTLRIPLTLAVVRALLFTVGGRTFAFPLNEISELMRVSEEDIIHSPDLAIKKDNEIIPLTSLARHLNIDAQNDDSPEKTSSLVLIVEPEGHRHGLMFDSIVGQKEIVIKNLGPHLRHVIGISGATIMGDGSVIPILNINELLGFAFVEQEKPTRSEKNIVTESTEILVVDDSVSVRTVVSKLMENQGWRTRTAKDGVDALEQVREKLPDLIVLDIEMPRMNGFEFLSSFRSLPDCENIPVLMLSSRTSTKHRDKAMELGASGFIVKPYKNNEFVQAVKEHLQGTILYSREE
jgi:chemosensory pili system protein ChpA (sensor histidine kinase/response regulator)